MPHTLTHSKRCSRCATEKPLPQFGLMSRSVDGRRPECRDCRKTESSAYWANLSDERKQAQRHRNDARKLAIQREVWAYLEEHPCADCSEVDPIVLEFDHVRGQKVANVSTLIISGATAAVWDEIAKCDVVCRNCHTRRTAKHFGWYRELLGDT